MEVNDELIDYIAALAKLSLNKDEKEQAKKDLERIINHFNCLDELDTEGVETAPDVSTLKNVYREDVVLDSGLRDIILSNAPEQKDGYFKVPKTVE